MKALRTIIFTVPEVGLLTGGYVAEMDTAKLVGDICGTEVVTFEKRCEGFRHIDDIVNDYNYNDSIFVVHWGPAVLTLMKKLNGKNVIYHAHSTGYGFDLPVDVPIVAVSRHSLAYWGSRAASSALFYVPNVIPDIFKNRHKLRDIDVFVQRRKSSSYLLECLIPRLEQEQIKVLLLDEWVEDVSIYFNRTKVYLYDSSEYWDQRGVSEGFGLPPMEAIACGCTVFSSLNHALSDYLMPGVNMHKIRCVNIDYDATRIVGAVKAWVDPDNEPILLAEYRSDQVLKYWEKTLIEINLFFNERKTFKSILPKCRVNADNFSIGESFIQKLKKIYRMVKKLIDK